MKSEIILGQKFGRWTVIDTVPIYTKGGQRNVKVRCDCGTEDYKHWGSLRLGKSKQCIVCKRLQRRIFISVGDKYKEYTVVSEGEIINGVLSYRVKCSCGHEKYMKPSAIISQTRWFKCKFCATQESIENYKVQNGKVGELTLSMLNRIKMKSEQRKIEFNISIEYLWSLFIYQNKKCAITGDLLSSIKEASLDRINSSIGYIEGNVQWTTKQANKCKHILTMKELYEFCMKTINHANQQPS